MNKNGHAHTLKEPFCMEQRFYVGGNAVSFIPWWEEGNVTRIQNNVKNEHFCTYNTETKKEYYNNGKHLLKFSMHSKSYWELDMNCLIELSK